MSTGTVSEVSESEVAVWLSWAQPFSTYPICTAFWKLVKKVDLRQANTPDGRPLDLGREVKEKLADAGALGHTHCLVCVTHTGVGFHYASVSRILWSERQTLLWFLRGHTWARHRAEGGGTDAS